MNWQRYKSLHSDLREEQIKEIDAMLLCNDPSKGFYAYHCSDCSHYFTKKFRCNSRACASCGASYVNAWSEKTTERLQKVNHSHIIFTMPVHLWSLIEADFDCIKELSDAVYQTLKEAYSETSNQELVLGVISSLHTYGEDMKYNVHFHCIVTSGGYSKKRDLFVEVEYIPFKLLRGKWKDLCLGVITKHMEKNLGNQILMESLRFHEYRNGFNVHVIKTKIPKKELVRYIARYIRHPPISNRRIVDYNGRQVTIKCGKKGPAYDVVLTVDEFIHRVISHIPKKGFKMIRSYGLYARKSCKKTPVKTTKQESITSYTRSKNSCKCPLCGKYVEPFEYFPPTQAIGPPNKHLFGEKISDWVTSS